MMPRPAKFKMQNEVLSLLLTARPDGFLQEAVKMGAAVHQSIGVGPSLHV